MRLHNTENTLAELVASRGGNNGGHSGNKAIIGGQGYVVGEIPYDPCAHEVTDIDMFSLSGSMLGRHYVSETVPENPLDINLIVHADPAETGDPEEIALSRAFLIGALNRSIQQSLLYGDGTKLYVVGRRDPNLLERGASHIRNTEQPASAAQAIARLCRFNGLGIVISTFQNLPLDQVEGARFKTTVGIKANHKWDRMIDRNIGPWPTGEPDMPVINTNDNWRGRPSREVDPYRFRQQQRHEEIVQRLEAAGIKMAEAVFDKTLAPMGFDVKGTDRSIARAIKRSGRSKR